MLRIVNDAADSAENRSKGTNRVKQKDGEQPKTSHRTLSPKNGNIARLNCRGASESANRRNGRVRQQLEKNEEGVRVVQEKAKSSATRILNGLARRSQKQKPRREQSTRKQLG